MIKVLVGNVTKWDTTSVYVFLSSKLKVNICEFDDRPLK